MNNSYVGLAVLMMMIILNGLVLLFKYHINLQPTVVSSRVKGMSVDNIGGVDHLVEKYFAPPGLFSVKDQLDRLQLVVDPQDRVVAIPDPEFGVGSLIEITRATRVTIIDAGGENQYHSWADTVETLLGDVKLNLNDKDRIEPSLDTKLIDQLVINITRVSIGRVKETELINYRIIIEKDSELEKGLKKVKQKGQSGLKVKTYEITTENSKEIERKLISSEITKQPENEIVVEGTKVIILGEGEATWYRWRLGGAAHNTLPKGTKVRVVNTANGKSTVVTINDRGIRGSAIIDLDHRAFSEIAPLGKGRIWVRLEKVNEL